MATHWAEDPPRVQLQWQRLLRSSAPSQLLPLPPQQHAATLHTSDNNETITMAAAAALSTLIGGVGKNTGAHVTSGRYNKLQIMACLHRAALVLEPAMLFLRR